MGNVRNTHLTITTPRKKTISLSLPIITSKLRKNRRTKFKNLYITPVNIFYKLPKKELLLALKITNLNITKSLANSPKRIRFY